MARACRRRAVAREREHGGAVRRASPRRRPLPAALALACAVWACGGSRGAQDAPSPAEDAARDADRISVRVENRTADPVQTWYQFDDGALYRLGEVTGSATGTFTFSWRAAERVRFHARAVARTRRERRASNDVPVRRGDRLLVIVEVATVRARLISEP